MITPFGNSRARVLATEDGNAVGASNALPVSVASGSGGVTEYTEDAAAAANPIGGALILVRRDTLTVAEVTTDGDNVAAKATSKGEQYVKASDTDVLAGGVTETAPATDTASSGLNGRLQRIAQRVTSLIALVPAALGAFGGLKVEGVVDEYETVAASQTAQVLGGSGATGDFIAGLLVIPATTSPGNVLLLDNAISITVFTGGATSVASLVPFFIPLGLKSVSGALKVTTGANVSVVAVGNFT